MTENYDSTIKLLETSKIEEVGQLESCGLGPASWQIPWLSNLIYPEIQPKTHQLRSPNMSPLSLQT